jgi:hypothetical protein
MRGRVGTMAGTMIQRDLTLGPRLAMAARDVLLAAGFAPAQPGGRECQVSELLPPGQFAFPRWFAGERTPGFVCAPYVDGESVMALVTYQPLSGPRAQAAAWLAQYAPAFRAARWGASPIQCWAPNGGTYPIPWTEGPGNPPFLLVWNTAVLR